MKNFSVIGVGSPIVDTLSRVPDSFLSTVRGEKGGMVMVEAPEMAELLSRLPGDVVQTPGGSAGNTLFDLAHFGVPTALLGTVGSDEAGRFYRAKLLEAGGSDRALRVAAGGTTARCLSMITPDAERTMRTMLGAALEFDPGAVDEADFAGYTLAYVEGYLLAHPAEKLAHLLGAAKRAGCLVALDLASFEIVRAFRPAIAELLKNFVDIAFANADEADALLGKMAVQTQLKKFRELVPQAIIKQGADGAWADTGSGAVFIPAQKVNAVDTTAAGDSFAAGFLYGALSGWDAAKSGKLAARLAAETVQVIGAALPEIAWQRLRQEIPAD